MAMRVPHSVVLPVIGPGALPTSLRCPMLMTGLHSEVVRPTSSHLSMPTTGRHSRVAHHTSSHLLMPTTVRYSGVRQATPQQVERMVTMTLSQLSVPTT